MYKNTFTSFIILFLSLFTIELSAISWELESTGHVCQYEYSANSTSGEAVYLEDLRGNECYAQPDRLVVCGVGDTIPIMLYTKSVEPIYNIELNVEFDEGLEYATFAYVDDPFNTNNADLDTINVSNPESVTFRINELDQAGGGAVIYIGVRAACGVDFETMKPGISYTLTYNNGVQNCVDVVRPDQDYAANVLTPGIQFTGSSTPVNASFTDFDTDNCITTTVAGLSPVAGLTEALFSIKNYGYSNGVELNSLTVNGITVPSSDMMTDNTTGDIIINLDGNQNPGYWGADGQLLLTETISIRACFRQFACTGEEFTPLFGVLSSCQGNYCSGLEDTESSTNLREQYAFNPTIITNFDNIQEPSFCSPTEPSPYVYETSAISTIADPIRGDFYNMLHYIDNCPSSFLSIDTAYITDGLGGNIVAGVTSDMMYANSAGRIYVDFRRLDIGIDLDGAGGLEDIDGDGQFDDLPAGEALFLRIELLPSCSPELLACGLTNDATCDITASRWYGLRNCGRNGYTQTQNVDDEIDGYANESEGMFDNQEMFTTSNVDYEGYFFDAAHGPANPQTESVQFSYILGANDFASCPGPGPIKLQLYFAGQDTFMQDLVLSNLMFNGSPATIESDLIGEGERRIIIGIGDDTPATTHTYNFDITFDNDWCNTRRIVNMQAIVMQECDGCDCTLAKACGNTVLSVDPRDPPEGCVDGENFVQIKRITTGYTDRDLSTRVNTEDLLDEEHTCVLPGDTLQLEGWITVYNATDWNLIDRSISFNMFHLQGGTGARSVLTSRIDMANLRVQRFELKRQSTNQLFDLGAIPFSGDFNNNSNNSSGAWVTSNRGNHDPTIVHPGLTDDQYVTGQWYNDVNDYADGYLGRIYLGLGEQFPNDQPAVQEFFDYIGGGFQNQDTIFITWQVPITSTPRFLNTGQPSIAGAELETGNFRLDVDGRAWSGSLSANLIGTRNNDAQYTYYEPYIRSERYIEYTNDGCDAELVQTFHIDNPPPAGCSVGEFRPIIGIEELEIDVPSEYVYAGGAYIQHYDQPQIPLPIDSVRNMIAVDIDGETGYMSCEPKGAFYFADAEFKDGLRANDYLGIDAGDDDISLTGGTFPMLGVGLNPDGTLPNDSITFRIPLVRSCGDAPNNELLQSTYSASYPYLPDYNIPTYDCNRGQWFGSPVATGNYCNDNNINRRYWPYDREDDGNPHHVANDSTWTLDVRGNLVNFTYNSEQFIPSGPIIDTPGSETTNYSINLNQPINFGTMVITVSTAVDLQMVDGIVPTQVGSTDSTKIYIHDMGAQPAGTYSVDLITDLIFCDEADICVEHLFCDPVNAAQLAQALSKSGKSCQALCFSYVSGLPELQVNYQFNNNAALCAVEDYNIIYTNVGTSDFNDFFPTVYLPEGMVFDGGSWEFATTGNPAVSIGDPIENTMKTGVNGTAYEWPAGTFDDIVEGASLSISFIGSTTCESTIGLPLVTAVNAAVACNQMFDSPVYRSTPITVALPPNPTPSFTFNTNELEVNCSGSTDILITALNTGKAAYEMSSVCMITPPGITISESDIEFVAPANSTIDNFTTEAIGAAGANKVCFDSPATLQGGFFCLKLSINADLECGPADILFTVLRTQSLTCTTTGEMCMPDIVASVDQFLRLEVVPGVALSAEPTVAAACSATPNSIDITYELPLKNPSPAIAYSGIVDVELYYDLDGNEDLGSIDPLLGSESTNISVAPNGTRTLNGTITVPADEGCGLIMRANVPGCTCGEIIIPIPEVLPDYIQELGSAVTLCPGETYDIEVPCGTPVYEFDPPEAGTASYVGTTLTIGLNPGFGVNAPVPFIMTSSIGSCQGQETMINLSQPESINYGPFDFYACSDGCLQLDFGLDPNITEDIEISISPSTFLDDPTSSEPTICNPTSDQTYTIDFMLNGQCMSSSSFNVFVSDPPTMTINMPGEECNTFGIDLSEVATFTPSTLDGTWISYDDGTFNNGTRYSTADLYIPSNAELDSGFVVLYLQSDDPDETNGSIAQSPCSSLLDRLVIDIIPCMDYGDLPDGGNGTGTLDYQTTIANNGPGHGYIEGLSLGADVSFEPDGQPNVTATGDDDNGVDVPNTATWPPGGTVNIPFSVTNTTGTPAELEVWIDFNGDGDFDDPGEFVSDLTGDGTGDFGTNVLTVNVPLDIVTGVPLGVRARLSYEDNMTPLGVVNSGEVEDYLIEIECKPNVCVPFSITRN